MIRIAAAVFLCSLLAACPNQARNDSIEHMNKAAEAKHNKQIETAVIEYKAAHNALPPGVKWREEMAVNIRR